MDYRHSTQWPALEKKVGPSDMDHAYAYDMSLLQMTQWCPLTEEIKARCMNQRHENSYAVVKFRSIP